MSTAIVPMKLSEKGGMFIRKWEKFEPRPYKDVVGYDTWGFGHKRVGNEPIPNLIGMVDALALFRKDVAPFERILNGALQVQLNQNQFDALLSLLYNTGPGFPKIKDGVIVLKNGQPSTILRQTNASAFDLAAAEFPKWDKAGGKEVQGLLNRRKEEQAIFQSPVF